MMNRKEDRLKANQRIVIKDEGVSYPAVISSLSKTGISVKMEHVCPTYKVIDIVVKVKQKIINLKGSVRWVNEAPPDSGDSLNEIGIALQDPPEDYLRNFE